MKHLKAANPESIFAVVLWCAGIAVFILQSNGIWTPDYADTLQNTLYLGAGVFGLYGVAIKWYKARKGQSDNDE